MIALYRAGPGEDLLPRVRRPEVGWRGPASDVALFGDGSHVVIRNVPAGNWRARVEGLRGGSARPEGFALPPGRHATIEIDLP